MEKFAHVPVEDDTIIKHSEVENLSDQGLIDIANEAGLLKGDKAVTVVRNSSGYAFVNMNFENPF